MNKKRHIALDFAKFARYNDDVGRKTEKKIKEKNMNELFAKCVLYAYPNTEALCDQIDELVEKKAFASINDYSPALSQCEKIVELTEHKDMLRDLKDKVEKVLRGFSENELKLLDYKYFKKLPKSDFDDFDCVSRSYFRRQVRVAAKFAKKIGDEGVTDEYFKKYFMTTDFFSELYKRVCEREISNNKNKKRSEKFLQKTVLEERVKAC